MYKVETIRQANKLLDVADYENNPVNEVFFNDKEKRIEIWSMLADDERMISSVSYPEEQDDATPDSFSDPAIPKRETDFGGSLIPTVLHAVAKVIEKGIDLATVEFEFDAEEEQLHVIDSSDRVIASIPY